MVAGVGLAGKAWLWSLRAAVAAEPFVADCPKAAVGCPDRFATLAPLVPISAVVAIRTQKDQAVADVQCRIHVSEESRRQQSWIQFDGSPVACRPIRTFRWIPVLPVVKGGSLCVVAVLGFR